MIWRFFKERLFMKKIKYDVSKHQKEIDLMTKYFPVNAILFIVFLGLAYLGIDLNLHYFKGLFCLLTLLDFAWMLCVCVFVCVHDSYKRKLGAKHEDK